MAVLDPAVVSEGSPRFVLPFFTNLTLYKDAEIRLRRREASARDAVAWTRKQLSYAWFANPRLARLCRGALSLAGKHLRLDHRVSRQQ